MSHTIHADLGIEKILKNEEPRKMDHGQVRSVCAPLDALRADLASVVDVPTALHAADSHIVQSRSIDKLLKNEKEDSSYQNTQTLGGADLGENLRSMTDTTIARV